MWKIVKVELIFTIQLSEKNKPAELTLEMMIPAIEILTAGPLRSLYLKSIPFQKEMT